MTNTSSQEPRDRSITGNIAFGASISIAATIGTRLLGIITIGVLGRVLTPQDFGVIAIALIFVGLSEAIMSRQFDLACIRTTDIADSHYNTNFTLSCLWGLFAGGTLLVLADPIATLMGEPKVAPVLRLLALVPVLDGLRNPYFVGYERGLNFVPDIGTNFAAKAAQTIASIALALWWGNYWAMAWALVVFTGARAILTHALKPSRIRFELTHWKEFLIFGGWLSGTGIMRFIMARTDTAMISSKLGTATVGLYNLAFELTQLATTYLAMPLMRIIYPGLSSMSHDRQRLKAAYYKAQAILLGILLPIGFGIALIAREAIIIFVGTKWLDAVPVLHILMPASAVAVLVYNVQAVIMVDGNTRAMFLRNLTVAIVQIPAIWFGLIWYGFVGAVTARALALLLHTGLTLAIAARVTKDPWWLTLTTAWRSFGAVVFMSAAILGLSAILPLPQTMPDAITSLVFKVSCGMTVYVVSHVLLWLASGRPEGIETFAWEMGSKTISRLTARLNRR